MSDGAELNGVTQANLTGGAGVASGAPASSEGASLQSAALQAAALQAAALQSAAAAGEASAPAAAQVAAAAASVQAPAPEAAKDAPEPKARKRRDEDETREDKDEKKLALAEDEEDLSGQIENFFAAIAAEESSAATAQVSDDDDDDGGIPVAILIGAGVLAVIGIAVLVFGNDEDKNEPPVAVADTGAVNEGASLTGSVATNDTDGDGDALTFALTGTAPAGLTFNPNGSFTFDANNAAYNGLAAGQTQQVVVNYTVTDGEDTASSTLTITVTGTNDAPTAAAVTGPAATEGGAAVSATVAGTDPDQGAVLTYALVSPVAGVSINATTGVVTLNPADPAYNGLAAGQTQQVVANVRVSDAQGASATTTVTFNVTGTNDAPVVTAQTGPAATEGGAAVTGTFAATDPEGGALTFALVEPVAGLTINSTTGAFTLDPTNAAFNNLAAGETRNVVANVRVTDAAGASTTQTLTFVVTGTNDAPVVAAQTGPAATEGGAAVTGTFAATDPEGQALTFALVEPVAGLTLNATTGAFSLNPADPSFSNLAAGETRNVVANVRVTDAQGASTTQTLTFVVTGVGAVTQTLDVDSDANLTTRFAITTNAGTGAFTFTDDDDVANTVRVNGFGADDTLIFDAGVSSVAFSNIDADGDGVANDLSITINKNGTVSDILLANSVDPNLIIFDEAGAEAAIGAGADNFRFGGVSTPPPVTGPVGQTAQGIDVDNDNNLNTYRLFDAGTDGFTFRDDADIANSVQIINLGPNDRIVLETGNTYAFANIDFDGDGLANDLQVIANKNGTVSDIIIKNAVDPNALVFNEATAEQALGNVDYFSFA